MKPSAITHFFAFILTAVALSGCASNAVDRLIRSDEKELPTDLRDKFEVKDTPTEVAAEPRPTPSPTPTPSPVKKKKSKRGAPAPLPSSAPEAFAYPHRRPSKDPVWIGEKDVYQITYFGLEAGNFTLEVLPLKDIDNRKVYHVRGTAESSKVFNLFYRLNDMVETFIDYDGFFSHRFHILLDETKQQRDSLELFDSQKKQTFFWNKWNHRENGFKETKTYAPIPAFPQDTLSSLFYLRALDLTPGRVYTFPVVSEGNYWDAEITAVKYEYMQTPMGRVRTIVLKPETKFQGNLKKTGGESYLWVTDDDRHILVRMEAKVKIGSVVAVLKKWEPGTPPAQ